LGTSVTLAQLENDPHPLLAALREREPVSFVPAIGGWLVTRYDLALKVMRDTATFTVDDPRFSTARVVGPSMLSLDGDEHARHREPFGAPFRPVAVRDRFAEPITDEAERLLDRLQPAGQAELRRSFAGPLAAFAMTRALGLEPDEVTTVLGWYDAIVSAVTQITAGNPLPQTGEDAFRKLHERLTEVIDAGGPTQTAPGQCSSSSSGTAATTPSVASSLLAAAAAGSELTHDQIISNAAVLLFGGIETTEGMIANVILHLLERPDQLRCVREQPRLIDAAIEESLRLEPAAAMVDRYATADTELAEAKIERGELVHVSIAGANRDPAVFGRPDELDLDRANARRHLAFAQGPHVCVGVHLARLEARTALIALLRRLPTVRLDPERPSAVRGLVFRKPPSLNVVWE
jgi:cytochrome P450